MLNRRALALATILGTVLQLAMVVSGHSNTSIANLFAAGGMAISLLAGVAYVFIARNGTAPSSPVVGGLVAGGLCAFIGILVSYLLGDVPALVMTFGTASSAVTGALGGWLGKLLRALHGNCSDLLFATKSGVCLEHQNPCVEHDHEQHAHHNLARLPGRTLEEWLARACGQSFAKTRLDADRRHRTHNF